MLRKLTVIIGGLVDQLFCQLIADSLEHQLSAEVNILAQSTPQSSVENIAVDEHADVIIVGLGESELPAICNRLLNRLPQAVVVGVASSIDATDGRKIRILHALHSDDMSLDQLTDTILAVMQKSITRAGCEGQVH